MATPGAPDWFTGKEIGRDEVGQHRDLPIEQIDRDLLANAVPVTNAQASKYGSDIRNAPVKSAMDGPVLTGGWSGVPVNARTPLSAWTTISMPGSAARGPVSPKAVSEQYTSRGLTDESDSKSSPALATAAAGTRRRRHRCAEPTARQSPCPRVLQVERHGPLTAVDAVVVAALTWCDEVVDSTKRLTARRFDLDDVGSEIPEQDVRRDGQDLRKVHDTHAIEHPACALRPRRLR